MAADGVTVDILLPGVIATDRARELGADGPERIAQIPAGRLGTVEEFCAAGAFLCSEAAAYITGTTLLVDGGASRADLTPPSNPVDDVLGFPQPDTSQFSIPLDRFDFLAALGERDHIRRYSRPRRRNHRPRRPRRIPKRHPELLPDPFGMLLEPAQPLVDPVDVLEQCFVTNRRHRVSFRPRCGPDPGATIHAAVGTRRRA